MFKKIGFYVFSLSLMCNISASQNIDQRMLKSIQINDIDNIIECIPHVTDVNTIAPLGASALSRLCDDAYSLEKSIAALTKSINAKPLNEDGWHTSWYAMLDQQNILIKRENIKQYHKTLDAIELLLSKKNINPNIVLFYTKNLYPKRTLPCLFRMVNNNTLANTQKLNIDAQDENGDTVLHKVLKNFAVYSSQQYYTENEHSDIMRARLLLQLGANIHIKNKDGVSVQDLLKANSGWEKCIVYRNILRENYPEDVVCNLEEEDEKEKNKEEKTIRTVQMPFYKEGRAPRYLVYPHENQKLQKSFSEGNLCSQLRNRAHGIRNTIHRLGGNKIQSQ